MKQSSATKISLLIPVKNGAATLPELFASLSLQTVVPTEILVSDSGSSDNSVGIATANGAHVIEIKPYDFDHGGTRTMLAGRAEGDLLIFMTQDAILKRSDALEKLIEPILKNDTIGASYGRQVPAFDALHFAESLRLFNYPQKSEVFCYKDRERVGIQAIFTSNSFACYRKESLAAIGYFRDGLIFGEDTCAIAEILKAGYCNAYVADAEVYHSHNYSLLEDFKRYFDIGVLHRRENRLLQEYGTATGRGRKYLRHEFAAIKRKRRYRLFFELAARLLVKYVGYKTGGFHERLPMKIIAACSMNSLWWQNGKKI